MPNSHISIEIEICFLTGREGIVLTWHESYFTYIATHTRKCNETRTLIKSRCGVKSLE
jgi:hypothetical protein